MFPKRQTNMHQIVVTSDKKFIEFNKPFHIIPWEMKNIDTEISASICMKPSKHGYISKSKEAAELGIHVIMSIF